MAPRSRAAGGKWSTSSTLADLGLAWTSGELARDYPDHVRAKKSADDDRQRLEAHVYPLAASVSVAAFALDDAEAIMRALPVGRAAATRRHVAQVLHRLMGIAVYPLQLRSSNPLPKGFLPKVGPGKAKGWIYPSEDRKLLASPSVPLAWRVFYGFLDRQGTRAGEASGLDVGNVDLDLGAAELDENKTDDPRTLPLGPDVAAALRAWIAHREAATGEKLSAAAPLFVDEDGARIDGEGKNLAKLFRAHLKAAGVDRAALFERSASRQQVRLHDLRASFVTLALANGQTETWVADRTGHKSSTMINKYRRAARTAAELRLGDLWCRSTRRSRSCGQPSRTTPRGEVPPGSATRGGRGRGGSARSRQKP